MLITRTPLRISIGGGGTDLPSYYEKHGGFLVTAAIDKRIYIGLNRIFTPEYVLKYSSAERVQALSEIRHPIMREALERHELKPGIEIASMADIPAGTGLGSSGTFTVGLLRAIHAHKREFISPEGLAEEACDVERAVEGFAGKQDQYAAAIGGIVCLEISKSGEVSVSPLRIPKDLLHHLEEHLTVYFTGYSRKASNLLLDQEQRTAKGDSKMVDNVHFVKETGYAIKEALESGEPEEFGKLLHAHWLHKRVRSDGMSNPCIDRWYETALANGALGGKLIGAGGGGFLLFYAPDRAKVRRAMKVEGLDEVRFRFDLDGSIVLARENG
jgi:D-glycero-alpha-D-manno-heptose-7-phosphate kinase